MRKIDAFAHILPPRYLVRLERQLERSMSHERLSYYREGVFRFDPSISDLDARRREIARTVATTYAGRSVRSRHVNRRAVQPAATRRF